MSFLHKTKVPSVNALPVGSTVRFTADGIEYTLYDVTDESKATAHGGIFNGEQVKIANAQINGENAGNGILFQQGASARLLGFVIRQDPPSDDERRFATQTNLVTGPVEHLTIDDDMVF